MYKSVLICGCLVAIAVTSASAATKANINSDWESFKNVHKKSYDSLLEETIRKAIFIANKDKVEHFNKYEAEKAGYKMGLNHLSDYTEDELKILRGFKAPKGFKAENNLEAKNFLDKILNSNQAVPLEVDWRNSIGRVTRVKDQVFCGSCWAFAATGGLEGQMTRRNITFTTLSEQNLVDCSKRNSGCSGGSMDSAYLDIADEGGIDNEASYIYMGWDSKCRFKPRNVTFNDLGAAYSKVGDEIMLKELVAKFGPIPVAIDASQHSFSLYKEGVYFDKNCSSDKLDHAVLVVGYGRDEKTKQDYWIIKNSWSKTWGDNGYMKMARNKENHCGLATNPTIPIV